VALARGLVARPDIIFADEPTGSLDSVSGEHVMNMLTDAARQVIVRDGTVSTLTGVAP
jgi:putative ABC transport system ATP-binding protein